MAGFEWQEEFELALSIVQDVSRIFIPAFSSPKVIATKSQANDLVTETDKAIERAIFSLIKKKYPADSLIGEEEEEESVWGRARTWIVDPIDGTMMFVHQNPDTCISIGFSVDMSMQFGVVYNPITRELFTGRCGFGAQLNGAPIKVSGVTAITSALLSTCIVSHLPHLSAINCGNITRLCSDPEPCHGLRATGSSVLALCSVAAGFTDAFWITGVHIWDMAAASVVLREAGGCLLSTVTGEEFDFRRRRVIAAGSQALASTLQSKIEPLPEGVYSFDP